MKIQVLVVIILFTITGCSPVIVRRQSLLLNEALPIECQGLNEMVSDGFFRLDKYDYFIIHNTISYKLLKTNDCVSNLSPQEIKLIFGEPSFETKEGLYYNLTTQKKNGMVMYGLIFHKKSENLIERAEMRIYSDESNKK